jgi:photosystem II stability/assembly factor-like uncharacterized protein
MKKNIFRSLSILVYLFIPKPLLAQWIPTNSLVGGFSPPGIFCFATSGTNLFAGGYGGIYRSTNDGISWVAIDSGLSNSKVCAFAIIDSSIFAGTYDGGAFLSTNNGSNWIAINTGLTSNHINTFAVSGANLFAGTESGVFLSTNNGTNWNERNTGLTNPDIQVLVATDTNLFVGTYSGGIFLSTNNGISWTAVNNGLPTNSYIYSLVALSNVTGGKNLFAGTGVWGSGSHGAPTVYAKGIYHSTNNGANWIAVDSFMTAYSFVVSGNNIFTGTGSGVFFSTNNGTSWIECNVGLIEWPVVYALAISGTNLFCALSVGSVWKRPLSDIITSVERRSTDLPTQFNLDQNYPNPFNPATNISFSIPSKSFVSLKVFDIMGREVSTITSEEMSVGNYSKQWNAANIPSGVYFYRLQAGSFTETKKMILLK